MWLLWKTSKNTNGLYHVLHGLISPMNGISPDDINLKSLMTRLMDSEVSEVIVATNVTADGEATLCLPSAPQASWYQGHSPSTGTQPWEQISSMRTKSHPYEPLKIGQSCRS